MGCDYATMLAPSPWKRREKTIESLSVCILSGVSRSRERFSETYLHKMCIVVSIGGRGLGHSRGSTRPTSDSPLPTYGIAFRTIGGQCFLVWKSPTKSLKHNTKLNLSEMYLSHKITLVNVCAYFGSRKVWAILSYRAEIWRSWGIWGPASLETFAKKSTPFPYIKTKNKKGEKWIFSCALIQYFCIACWPTKCRPI